MHHPIIVIEGPDATGKTTWADTFCEKYRGRKIHLTLRKQMWEYQIGAIELAIRWSRECPVVIDRHWASEQIYAGAYRGASYLQEEAKWMAKALSDIGVFYVGALMGVERMICAHAEESRKRDEMYLPSPEYRQVVLGFWDWWHGTKYADIDAGYCQTFTPMCEKYMSAYRYDRDTDGASDELLHIHLEQVYALAAARRKFVMAESASQRLCNETRRFAAECGYR
jgi:hypothetical protein